MGLQRQSRPVWSAVGPAIAAILLSGCAAPSDRDDLAPPARLAAAAPLTRVEMLARLPAGSIPEATAESATYAPLDRRWLLGEFSSAYWHALTRSGVWRYRQAWRCGAYADAYLLLLRAAHAKSGSLAEAPAAAVVIIPAGDQYHAVNLVVTGEGPIVVDPQLPGERASIAPAIWAAARWPRLP